MKKVCFGLILSSILAVFAFGARDMTVEDHEEMIKGIEFVKKMVPMKMDETNTITMREVDYYPSLRLVTYEIDMNMDFKVMPKNLIEAISKNLQDEVLKNVCNSDDIKRDFGRFNDFKMQYIYRSLDNVFYKDLTIDLQKDCNWL